uniref:Uncharacterized protein n=1 Tax=mine drainage metagenome TaxID=410659 RepID=E6PUA5_9ZZZZ
MFDTHESAGLWSLGLRIESAADARLAAWLQTRLGAQPLREAALALASRKQPRPLKVARALGLTLPPEFAQSDTTPTLQDLRRHDQARRQGWPQPLDGR